MIRRLRLALILLCAFAGAVAAAGSSWPAAGYVRTEDRNGDGRPDVWRVYDRSGHTSRVRIDLNFDGRSDVEEYYERGVLVRRESDRNFDGRIDLADEFDPATGEQVRSVQDVDFDGAADLLVLFRDGQSVYSEWAGPATPAAAQAAPRPAAADQLAPLMDPFRHGQTVRSVGVAAATDACVGVSKSCIPANRGRFGSSLVASSASLSIRTHHASAPGALYPKRGPPTALHS
jgi:hypothetical protein